MILLARVITDVVNASISCIDLRAVGRFMNAEAETASGLSLTRIVVLSQCFQ